MTCVYLGRSLPFGAVGVVAPYFKTVKKAFQKLDEGSYVLEDAGDLKTNFLVNNIPTAVNLDQGKIMLPGGQRESKFHQTLSLYWKDNKFVVFNTMDSEHVKIMEVETVNEKVLEPEVDDKRPNLIHVLNVVLNDHYVKVGFTQKMWFVRTLKLEGDAQWKTWFLTEKIPNSECFFLIEQNQIVLIEKTKKRPISSAGTIWKVKTTFWMDDVLMTQEPLAEEPTRVKEYVEELKTDSDSSAEDDQ